ncbi:elongation factor 1-alpha [Culex quinquefasciatus]|uniref:Elongation factor 1-alpha n=1 Tax=Culex quinquefasciatus TaxID=7176 RepID=B0W9A3_CULQU|nr:elongation factor 1-alpha [Culex quinquefasciatus]|eukprot:XP_001845287.1 elongation factor 1-alpha [Culex quinquefasciatus]
MEIRRIWRRKNGRRDKREKITSCVCPSRDFAYEAKALPLGYVARSMFLAGLWSRSRSRYCSTSQNWPLYLLRNGLSRISIRMLLLEKDPGVAARSSSRFCGITGTPCTLVEAADLVPECSSRAQPAGFTALFRSIISKNGPEGMPCSPSPSLIAGVTKMESTELPYNDARFEEIKKEILSYIQKNGYNPSTVAIVPISGWHGANMLHQDVLVQGMGHRMQEGKADGKYLLETMDGVLTPTRPTDKPLHLLPLKDVNKTVRRNATRSPTGGRARTQRITAQVIVLNHSGQISNGYTPVLECHTAHIACEYSEIKEKVFRRSGKSTEDHPKSIKSGDDTIVFLVPP